jgi:hypothetical protein
MKKKISQTTRKFYNKWDHKLSFGFKNVSIFRNFSSEEIRAKNGNPSLTGIINFLNNQDTTSYAKRIERNVLDIYTNDTVLFDYLYEKFQENLRSAFSPGSQLSENSIVAKKYPHDRYRYKVFLQPHKIKSEDDRLRYINWLETQKPGISITDTVKKWFYKTSWNWDRRYMYVEDDKVLLMLKLKNPEALGTVYTYTIVDK